MDQIFFKDWTVPHLGREKYFLNAEDLENCVTERILRNTFHDPLISSDDEEPEDIDWNEVFKNKKNNEKNHRLFIPGCRGVPKYPKLSSLSPVQHTQLLKVICANNPHILPQKNFPRPSRIDVKMFESLKSQYEEEKRDFIDWAKTLWASEHCIRALRPKPPVELAYEAQFKLRATELQSYPKTFSLAAQIPLQGNGDFEMTFCEELIRINEKDLPEIKQEMIEEKLSIIKPGAVPEPCIKHPCKFILPMEKSVSILPLTEIERELAQYALEQGAQYIASESALQCLLSFGRAWNITVNICEVIDSNGDKTNVTVLGSEFAIKKENVLQRTYKAFKHLLEDALIPLSERANLLSKLANRDDDDDLNITSMDIPEPVLEPSSDDEETNLCIDICDDILKNCAKENSQKKEDDVTQETPLPNNNTMHKFWLL
ncbi:unnamed protein product [Leptosia nina]|uniref:Uncharacterized protein n=1 Tax=Leptosia nina TaxID=320188 RepID=A0AAV1JPW9_9NEOP